MQKLSFAGNVSASQKNTPKENYGNNKNREMRKMKSNIGRRDVVFMRFRNGKPEFEMKRRPVALTRGGQNKVIRALQMKHKDITELRNDWCFSVRIINEKKINGYMVPVVDPIIDLKSTEERARALKLNIGDVKFIYIRKGERVVSTRDSSGNWNRERIDVPVGNINRDIDTRTFVFERDDAPRLLKAIKKGHKIAWVKIIDIKRSVIIAECIRTDEKVNLNYEDRIIESAQFYSVQGTQARAEKYMGTYYREDANGALRNVHKPDSEFELVSEGGGTITIKTE